MVLGGKEEVIFVAAVFVVKAQLLAVCPCVVRGNCCIFGVLSFLFWVRLV